jgi:hypothetical protein
MKAGIIDLFVDSFGWVLGKTFLFALAVMTGMAIGGFALWAGTKTGGDAFGFNGGEASIFSHLASVIAILPQIVLLFWAGMVFVRSEGAEMRHWGYVASLEALLLTVCFSKALPGGVGAQIVAWTVTLVSIGVLRVCLRKIEGWKMQRGMDHLAQLEEFNNARRAELKEKFGTENTSARELGFL